MGPITYSVCPCPVFPDKSDVTR